MIVGAVKGINVSFNPFYGQIVDNGAIGLRISNDLPKCLYTPIGEIYIPMIYTRWHFGERQLLNRLIDVFGLVTVEEKKFDSIGSYGPIYAITKFPWSNSEIPIFKRRQREDYISQQEAQKLYSKFSRS